MQDVSYTFLIKRAPCKESGLHKRWITQVERRWLEGKPVLLREQFVLIDLSPTPLCGITGTLLPLIKYYHFSELLLTCSTLVSMLI